MSYKRILTANNSKMLKTMKAHPELEIRVVSMPCKVTCPFRGACEKGCYADHGRQAMESCQRAYRENLAMVMDGTFFPQLRAELSAYLIQAERNGVEPCVRVHDSGDFMNEKYLDDWLELMREFPTINFYAYTKCVDWMDSRDIPLNFKVTYSYGGKQDDFIYNFMPHAHVIGKDDPVPEGYLDGSETEYYALRGERRIVLRYHGSKAGEFKTI